jgi:hypothetical protein
LIDFVADTAKRAIRQLVPRPRETNDAHLRNAPEASGQSARQTISSA